MVLANYLDIAELLIKVNMNKLPNYYEHMYDCTNDELIDELKEYQKEFIINAKYYGLLESVAKLINKVDLDISIIKKSTLKLINDYHRIRTLNKIYYSEPEEISDNDDDDDDDDEISDNNKQEISKKPIITDKEHENDLRIILRQAINNNDRELTISTIELFKKFDNNVSTTVSTTNTGTPNWLKPLKCTVNPENTKKLCNQSFKYAIAASKVIGDKNHRLSKIEKHLHEFNFDTTNDYETFENNNKSIKLMILKETNNEKELVFKYNDTNKNDRPIKLCLIHLNSNHYIYVTKFNLISKYIKFN